MYDFGGEVAYKTVGPNAASVLTNLNFASRSPLNYAARVGLPLTLFPTSYIVELFLQIYGHLRKFGTMPTAPQPLKTDE